MNTNQKNQEEHQIFSHGCPGQCRDLYGDPVFPRYKKFTLKEVSYAGFCCWVEKNVFSCSNTTKGKNWLCIDHHKQKIIQTKEKEKEKQLMVLQQKEEEKRMASLGGEWPAL